MNPILRPRTSACWSSLSRATLLPSSQYSPRDGTSRQPRMFINVDLPDPDEPITATYSPASTRSDTPWSACSAVSPWPYVLVTSRISIRCSAARKASATGATRTAGARAAPATEAAAGARARELTPAELPLPVLGAGAPDRALEQLDLIALVQTGRDLRIAVTADPDLHLTGPAAVGHGHGVRRTVRRDRGTRDVQRVDGLRGLDRD